jgi:lysophospholipase L1-like esterase
MTRERHGPPGLAVTVLAVAVLAGTAACTSSGPGGFVPTSSPVGPTIRYVAVGASETVGIGSDDMLREAWPQVFYRTALPLGATYVNLGIPGATVADALREEVPDAVALRADVVTVWLNVNDIHAGVPAPAYERDLLRLVTELRRGGRTRVLLANTPPIDHLPSILGAFSPPSPSLADLRATIDAYNAAIARVASATGAVLVDLHAVGEAAVQSGTFDRLVAADGFHPNDAGHRAVAAAFAQAYRGLPAAA